ncbi:hypothetical protein [uncultured Shewanella sp.]|uniref:hypothetical protein n=1 Tax=uncultured Shewanella sp. TaxID=173975 RepID=UPI002627A31F|nr:hypothetical protein [uncultured Shewanella sp.]
MYRLTGQVLSFFIFLISSLAYAADDTDCHVPEKIDQSTLLFTVDEEYSIFSPETVGLIEVVFNQGSLETRIIQERLTFVGRYVYQVLEKDFSMIKVSELDANTVSNYYLLLVCSSDIEGYYIYRLQGGEDMPGVSHWTGRYIIRLPQKPLGEE